MHWYRPNHVFLSGATWPVAAGGLESYFDKIGYAHSLYPYAANGFCQDCEMRAHHKTHKGKVTWVLQARHDGDEPHLMCQFISKFLVNLWVFMSVYQPDDGITVDIPELLKSRDLILRDLCESFLYFSIVQLLLPWISFQNHRCTWMAKSTQKDRIELVSYQEKFMQSFFSFPSVSNSSASSSSVSSPTIASSSQQPQSQSLMLVFL